MFGYKPNLLNVLTNPLGDYPIDRERFDSARLEVCNGYSTDGWTGVTTDTANTFEGNNTVKLEKIEGKGSPSGYKTLSSPVDLSNHNYFDLFIFINDFVATDIKLRFHTEIAYYEASLSNYYKPTYMDRKTGWRRIRVPKSAFTIGNGTPNWASINGFWFASAYSYTSSVGYHLFAKIDAVTVPNALISIDFDDGVGTVYDTALYIMKSNNLIGSAYINTSVINQEANMTWEQLRDLRDEGWLIGSHCHEHLNLIELTVDEIRSQLDMSQKYLRRHGLITGSYFIATPNGTMNEIVMTEIKKRFISARYGLGSDSIIPPVTPYRLRYLSVAVTDTVDSLEAIVDDAITNKSWHFFTFHSIVDVPSSATHYSTANFTDFCGRLKTKIDAGEIKVVTPLDVILQADAVTLDKIANGIDLILNTVKNRDYL